MNNNFDISKYKPFDLQRAIAGDRMIDANGNIIEYGTHNFNFIICWLENGDYYPYRMSEVNSMLFMLPKERTVWVNLYERIGGQLYSGIVYDENETAIKNINPSDTYIGTFPITIKE